MIEGSTNLYEALGLTPEASEEKIRKTCKKMTKSVRESDSKNSEKNELIRFIKKSRNTLIDPESREKYDRTIGIETLGPDTLQKDTDGYNPLSGFMGSLGPILSSMHGFGSVAEPSRDNNHELVPFRQNNHESVGAMMNGLMNSQVMGKGLIPDEMIESMGELKSGGFHVMEYTRVRNENGGFDEYGFTKEGDMNNDRVKEKRFHKKA